MVDAGMEPVFTSSLAVVSTASSLWAVSTACSAQERGDMQADSSIVDNGAILLDGRSGVLSTGWLGRDTAHRC